LNKAGVDPNGNTALSLATKYINRGSTKKTIEMLESVTTDLIEDLI
jgi:hypothetical protein